MFIFYFDLLNDIFTSHFTKKNKKGTRTEIKKNVKGYQKCAIFQTFVIENCVRCVFLVWTIWIIILTSFGEPLAKNQVVVAKMGGQKITKLDFHPYIKMPFIIPYYDKDYLYHC